MTQSLKNLGIGLTWAAIGALLNSMCNPAEECDCNLNLQPLEQMAPTDLLEEIKSFQSFESYETA